MPGSPGEDKKTGCSLLWVASLSDQMPAPSASPTSPGRAPRQLLRPRPALEQSALRRCRVLGELPPTIYRRPRRDFPQLQRGGFPADTPAAPQCLCSGRHRAGLHLQGGPPHLEHLLHPLPGKVHVQLVQQLQNLADAQAPVPILVGFVERLLQPL